MKKIIQLVLESLRNLDMDAAKKLYDNSGRAGFYPPESLTENIMYIFPDGRVLAGDTIYHEVEASDGSMVIDEDRQTYHHHLYAAVPSGNYTHHDLHPMQDDLLNDIYNLVVVVPMDEEGTIFIPEATVPTFAQMEMIERLKLEGYDVKDFTPYKLFSVSLSEYEEYIKSLGLI